MPSLVKSKISIFYFAKFQARVPVEAGRFLRLLLRLNTAENHYDCVQSGVLIYDERMPRQILSHFYIQRIDREGEGIEKNPVRARIRVYRETF